MLKKTVRSGSNIAFIKYWGVEDAVLNIPLNSSVSMTLADAHATTTVEWDESGRMSADKITVNGTSLPDEASARVVRHLDRIRTLGGIDLGAQVASESNFPIASGIASSACGFSALSVAATRALGMELTWTELSALSRRGSGSASRSLFGGYVQWDKGDDDASSVARQLYAADHWKLIDVVAVVSVAPKNVSSEGGHGMAPSSPLNSGRVQNAEATLDRVVAAIRDRDLRTLGPLIELDALAMHAVMMTSTPRLFYWLPGTMEIMLAVQRWREEDGLQAYFTIDAGPNVHVICEPDSADEIKLRLDSLECVSSLITSGPGPEPQELDTHLF